MTGNVNKFFIYIFKILFLYFLILLCKYIFEIFENKYILIEFLLLSVLSVVYCVFTDNINLKTNKLNYKILKKVKNFKNNSRNNIYYLDEKYMKYIENAFNCIEEKYKNIFFEKGFIIIVAAENELKENYKLNKINGLFSSSEKYILISISEEATEREIIKTFFHEFGHFVDYVNKNISFSTKFLKIYLNQKNNFVRNLKIFYKNRKELKIHIPYEYTKCSEFFAENYSRYKMGLFIEKDIFNILNKI